MATTTTTKHKNNNDDERIRENCAWERVVGGYTVGGKILVAQTKHRSTHNHCVCFVIVLQVLGEGDGCRLVRVTLLEDTLSTTAHSWRAFT